MLTSGDLRWMFFSYFAVAVFGMVNDDRRPPGATVPGNPEDELVVLGCGNVEDGVLRIPAGVWDDGTIGVEAVARGRPDMLVIGRWWRREKGPSNRW